MKTFLNALLLLTLASATTRAQINAGDLKPEPSLPFTMTEVATFKLPWRIAFLPDGRMLITEKVGPVWLVTQEGEKTPVDNVPAVLYQGQGGMLGVFVSPHYATDHSVYLTYAEPGDGGSGLALARARLALGESTASLEGLQVLWRQMPKGRGGQFGAQIAFSPDGQYLFLTVGDRQRMTPAQDSNQALGKILRLTLDGKPAPGNPMAGKTGAATVPLINPPRDTEVAKTASEISTYTFPEPNMAPSETWSSGHRTPYGLAFGPDGRLWEVEHGPRGGDELNLIEPGKNYGWPLASYATNYNGVPIPSPDTRPDLTKPVIYWTPIIAPGNLTFYNGALFPQWRGSALMSGIATQTLNRIAFDGKGGATPAERWSVGHRIRDVEVGPDGALWMLEDANPGALFRVMPKPPATLPPAYPRPGATKILDNAAVQVWNIAWLKGQPSPLHKHIYDLSGVYYEPGDRMIISPEGAKRPVSTKAWDISFQRKDVTHIEEGTSDSPLRAIFVEMKQPAPYGTATAADAAPAFSGAGATQKLDNDRVTVWEYVGPIAAARHTHVHDTVAVAIETPAPRVTWIPKGTAHADEGAPRASRVYLFEIK